VDALESDVEEVGFLVEPKKAVEKKAQTDHPSSQHDLRTFESAAAPSFRTSLACM
jgi:hypothetical protein